MAINFQKEPESTYENNSSAAANGYAPSGPQVRPWVRYWARMIDICLFAGLFGFVCGVACPSVLEVPDVFFNVINLLLLIFVEPLLLSTWGTTPGKALLKVRLRKKNGEKVTYEEGLLRSVKVCWRGLGLGIPIVALFTQITAYNSLNKTGITSWDKDGNTQITHQSISWWRAITAVLLLGVFLVLILIAEST